MNSAFRAPQNAAHRPSRRRARLPVCVESSITFRRVIVADRDVIGKTVRKLDLDDRFGIAVKRVTWADIEMSAVPALRLRFGDTVRF